jgi:pyruvate kinase
MPRAERFRRARIVCTLGPASEKRETVDGLVRGGMDVARLNFSHGEHGAHERLFRTVRAAAKRAGRPVAVLQDLQGIKIRTGTFPGGSMELKKGAKTLLVPGRGEGSKERIPVSYEDLARHGKKGDRVLIDDGLVELRVTGKRGNALTAEVVEGGVVKDRKGVNLPGMNVAMESFTPKDRRDLEFGLALGVDYVAVSFVREAEDIRKVRRFMARKKRPSLPLLIAKIEKPEAVADIDAILDEVDGIMVARGDLGVEMATEEVPLIQKELIGRANARGRLVITATQMLESMTAHKTPTRAEATDVANAVIDGSDALMLSAETSAGRHPLLALRMMDRIIRKTESTIPAVPSYLSGNSHSEAVAAAASRAAEAVGAKYVVAFTQSGYSALLLSKERPAVPIVAFTPSEDVCRRMALSWGVIPVGMRKLVSTDPVLREVEKKLLGEGLAKKGDHVVITASVPIDRMGKTNMLKLHRVGELGK